MKAWKHLGVVETIHEEKEYEYSSSTSPSLSPTISSPPTPLHTRVQACYVNQVAGMGAEDRHLDKRSWKVFSSAQVFTLSPPLKITAETFALIADFCYGTNIVITPFNVAALRTAAELLEMTESNDEGEENLLQITETYFYRIIAVNREYALIVFRSCLSLLPEAETTAYLVSRCVEALSSVEDDGRGHNVACFDDVIPMSPEDFLIVTDSMHRRLTSHDVLYRTVTLYFKGYSGKLTEEQKTHICNSIDCNKLSPQLLLEAVQNPTMPIRFMVRAMLMEQLNTRRSILSATDRTQPPRRQRIINEHPTTLGAILQREKAARQAAHLKAAMDATSSRIESLEKELSVMKKLLNEPDTQRSIMGSARSSSFHYGGGSENKIERVDRGSASLRFFVRGGRGSSSSLEASSTDLAETPRTRKNMRQRLIYGLKTAFRVPKLSASKNEFESRKSSRVDQMGIRDEDEYGDVIYL
ncbi:BTB/POZ domain-containing protein At3g49900-like isoform X1 [Corylus avellana]|uniref:BTB/POZ domain-containing protein At3g49900-like isoform X1 n=1 Tax=Corylus avellana TaxID=13451 RepID=UPI00286C0A83|nr:BTB/POZ domain-containing protein At3g49900-like isoform X1 [Corylus avellana]